ncbi:pyridoxamine 5'-phosphate oxidase family protein [Streptomyces sp. NPDC056600]|uniref:pyridoxamine 5'-phosphate oxidase family protein n=1 Tax=Streptomyces sp. NPDC056600 TaxID=3345874 RepID=UPI0036CDD3FF
MYLNDGFRELDRPESLRLLGTAAIGRIVHTRQALPAVLPVNFCLDDDGAVVLRTSAASELARAVDGTVVAFEADEVDRAARSGWSVLLTGAAEVVTDPAEHRRLAERGPRSWVAVPPRQEVFIRILPELVTGRKVVGDRAPHDAEIGARPAPAGTGGPPPVPRSPAPA